MSRATLPAPAPAEAVPALLGHYQALERTSTQMLGAAQGGDWEGVARLEGACTLLIARLRHAASDLPPLDREQLREKQRLMRRIVANDARLRELAEPWRDALDRLLDGRRRPAH